MVGHHHGGIQVGTKLKIGIILSVFILAIEVTGGLLANSLALLSDAGHVFTDIIALTLSWYGVRQAERPSNARMTFGYHRVGVIVAIVNAISIFAIAGIIFYEAYSRFLSPPDVDSSLMIGVGILGLSVNVFVASWLRREQRTNLNVRSAFWHALGDALASIGVIAGGVIIAFTGVLLVDPVIAMAIGVIISYAAWTILREGFRVILEAPPRHVNVEAMVSAIKGIPGVRDVHDVHVWSISPELHAMSSHVLIDDLPLSEAAEIQRDIREVVARQFGVGHSTVQIECQRCDPHDLFCSLKMGEDRDQEGSQHS
ncbi:MAG: cation transporter [Dehalococcoidia bacterium]|nr:cation transporter [Dehalococcoidia bacterium]